MARPLTGIEACQALDRAMGQLDRFGHQHVTFTPVEREIATRQLRQVLVLAVTIKRMLTDPSDYEEHRDSAPLQTVRQHDRTWRRV